MAIDNRVPPQRSINNKDHNDINTGSDMAKNGRKKSYQRYENNTPSVLKAVFYTLILPMSFFVLYAKMNALPGASSAARTNNDPVKRHQQQKPIDSSYQEKNTREPVNVDHKKTMAKPRKSSYHAEHEQQAATTIDERSNTKSESNKNDDKATEIFLREWDRILSTQVPRGIDDRRTDMDNKIEELRRKVRSEPEDYNLLGK